MNIKIISISILVAAGLISASIFYSYGLDTLVNIFNIIGSLSIGVALLAYLYKKKQDRTLAAIDQITFFREKVIPQWDEVQKVIMIKDPKFWFSRIKLGKDSSIEDIKKNFSRNFKNQLSVFFSIQKVDGELQINLDSSILNQQIHLFNVLEELSLKVNHFATETHPALRSLQTTFVELVEKNATSLIFIRDIITSHSIYASILELYSIWGGCVKRPNLTQNLEKHGFITKEQLEKILKKQRTQAQALSQDVE